MECEQIGACTLYRGDCYTLLPDLRADAVVSDPPYGMHWNVNSRRFSGFDPASNPKGSCLGQRTPIYGDQDGVTLGFVHQFPEAIIWGYNHLIDQLGPGGVLIWLKRFETAFQTFLSDAELAWVKGKRGVYCRRDVSMHGLTSARQHPAQKPVSILAWCLTFIKGQTILDPFMGVGSTALGCLQQGKAFVGVEIDPRYFDLACQRITDAYAQPDLFVPQPVQPQQQALFAGGR